jgi:hypothetical protein
MTPSNWSNGRICRGIILPIALLSASATIGAQEKPGAPQTGSPPIAQTQSGTPSTAQKGKHPGRPCVPVTETASEPGQNINKDMCVSAHIYDVVELPDGTRFLDVCPADLPDEQCRFTLLSLRTDRDDVGDLRRYRNQNVEVRGTVRSMHGRIGMRDQSRATVQRRSGKVQA